MKTPRKVNVLGKTFKVRKRKVKGDHLGEMHYGDQIIIVVPKQALEQEKDTLWHELIHAVDESLGLELTERQVHALAAAQVQIMFDNPKLMEYILK